VGAPTLISAGHMGSACLPSFLGLGTVPLMGAYATCEAFGWETGIDWDWRQAPAFYSGGARRVLVPRRAGPRRGEATHPRLPSPPSPGAGPARRWVAPPARALARARARRRPAPRRR
jgi:hypothetical protein